jgi:hypothetical protein
MARFTLQESTRYKPGSWAMASTIVMAVGWLINILVAFSDGIDTGLVGFFCLVGILLCGILPTICGAIAYRFGRAPSQRRADIAFAVCMVAQGLVLAMIPAI